MMEEMITMHEWGYGFVLKDNWNAASDLNEEGFLDFSSLEFPCWNGGFLEENELPFISPSISESLSSMGEDLMQITDDLIIDECEDFIVYDEKFSSERCDGLEDPSSVEFSSMEDDLMDVMELPNDGEGKIMDSEGLCEDSGAEVSSLQNISSESVSGSDCTGYNDCSVLIPCSTDSEEYRGLRLVHLLTACAEAISDGAHDLVEIILCRLRELVSPTGSSMQRVAYYLSQSLHDLHYCSGHGSYKSTKDLNYMGALSLLNQAYPYMRFAHFTANQSILEAIPAETQKVIHIIDFDIMEGMQWPPLMEALISENYKIGQLKITVVNWEDDDDDSSCCKDTGRRLYEYASSLGIPFSFQETELENVKAMISSNEDCQEIVMVNCMWGLPHMFERSREQLLQFIDEACSLNPAILTLGSGPNGITSHEKLSFMDRFAQCLKNLCAVFDSVEAGMTDEYGLARATVERLFMGPLMCRPINYSSEDLGIHVLDIPIKCEMGFARADISKKNATYAKYMAEGGKQYRAERGGDNQLVLCWQSTPLTGVSAWKPTIWR